ncbi:hypothetical protein D9O50_02045 [Oxalobacteraceae bacterium CAVE-383]|nr:hypothetical protein D9O50_02045 [Oxalobacteraceae bacterium CAVE-383]
MLLLEQRSRYASMHLPMPMHLEPLIAAIAPMPLKQRVKQSGKQAVKQAVKQLLAWAAKPPQPLLQSGVQ